MLYCTSWTVLAPSYLVLTKERRTSFNELTVLFTHDIDVAIGSGFQDSHKIIFVRIGLCSALVISGGCGPFFVGF